MTDMRILKHPILKDINDFKTIQFTFNQQKYSALEGDTIASALLSHGVRTLRRHESSNQPRGIYCNIGHCFECRVLMNNEPNIRACMTLVENGMKIQSALDPLGECTND